MHFLIVGCGSIGKRHAGNLIKLGHSVAAFNRGESRRKEMQDLFGIKVYADLPEMLNMEKAEAAFICTPNSLHLQHALIAARHDLNLFIEKPLSHTMEGLNELKYLVSSRGLITHVGANLRFHFGPSMIKKNILSGKIGRPLWAHLWAGMHLPDWHPEEDYRVMYSAKANLGGGATLDFIHELDLVCWMFGDPDRLAAMTGKSGWLEIETEDVVDVILSYSGGLRVTVHLDYLQRPFQRGIRVVGNKGWVNWDLVSQQIGWFDHDSNRLESRAYPKDYEHNTMYMEQMAYFIECLRKKNISASDLGAGRQALELAIRIKESAMRDVFLHKDQLC